MITTYSNELKTILVDLNKLTGKNHLALQAYELGRDVSSIVIINKVYDKGFENVQIFFDLGDEMVLLAVDAERNIIDLTDSYATIVNEKSLLKIKEEIALLGEVEGLQSAKDKKVLFYSPF